MVLIKKSNEFPTSLDLPSWSLPCCVIGRSALLSECSEQREQPHPSVHHRVPVRRQDGCVKILVSVDRRGVSDPRPAWSALAQIVDDDRPRALLVRISCRGHV